MALTWFSCAVLCCSLTSLSWTFNLPTHQSPASKEELVSFLLSRSKQYVIPETADGSPLAVKVGLTPIRIVSLEDDILTVLVWETIEWTDPRLVWKDNIFGFGIGIQSVILPAHFVWTPDIEYYNVVTKPEQLLQQINVMLIDGGELSLIHYKKLTPTCNETGASTYNCTIKVGSWMHSGQSLDLSPLTESIDLPLSQPTKWTIVGATVQKNVIQYSCCPEPYVDVTYTYSVQCTACLLNKLV